MVSQFSTFDCEMMEQALFEAKQASDLGEVPVGAVLVLKEEIIARGHNLTESRKDATAHAEMICMREGAKIMRDWRLLGTTLYTTLEPCVMCGGAILLSRLSRVVWAAPDCRHGSNGSWVNLFEKKHPTHQLKIVGGLYEVRAAELMRLFFKKRRKQVGKKTRRAF